MLYDRKHNLARLKNWDAILEVNRQNLKLGLERKVSTIKHSVWNNNTDVEYVMRHDFCPQILLKEDNTYVPRFNIKRQSNPLFAEFQPNRELKYSRDLMEKAINYGMIISIQYRGETGSSKDNFVQGHQRVIYPMVLGKSSKGKMLLRGYHLRGWSVSRNGNTQKDWRMFRADRILSMSFTGAFFRLPPVGYNMDDKGMRGGIIVAADFDIIRNNQKKLIQKEVIQNKTEVVLDGKKSIVVQVDKTDTVLDLDDPFANPNISEEDKKIIRLTFLKSMTTNRYIAVVGALGQRGHVVKLTERGKYLGTFKVLKSTMGDGLGKPHLRNVDGKSEYELKVFIKKLN
jgi:hypothetical protein